MSRVLRVLFVLLALATPAAAQVSGPPHVFVADTVINPDEVNLNFSTIYAAACNRGGCTMTGNLLFSADNTLDIGASGANRPRDLFLGRNAAIGGTLGVTGAATLSSTLGVTGATTLSSTLGVTGATTLAALSATTGTFSSTLAVTGNTTVGGTLGVTGASTIAALSATSGTFSSTLGVTGNTTIGGTLGVTGATTLAALTATNGTFSAATLVSAALNVTGTVTATAAFVLSGTITPSTLASGNNNNYNPTGLSTAYKIRITPNAAGSTITGLAGGAEGREAMICQPTSTSPNAIISNEDANSTAANRFNLGAAALQFYKPSSGGIQGPCAVFHYDGASSRWLLKSTAHIEP